MIERNRDAHFLLQWKSMSAGGAARQSWVYPGNNGCEQDSGEEGEGPQCLKTRGMEDEAEPYPD